MTLLTVLLPIQIFYQHHNDPIKIKMGVAWFCNFTITPHKMSRFVATIVCEFEIVCIILLYTIVSIKCTLCGARSFENDDEEKEEEEENFVSFLVRIYSRELQQNRVLEKRNRFL